MKTKRLFSTDSENGPPSKRRLIESLKHLSLDPAISSRSSTVEASTSSDSTDGVEYMDVYKDNTEFIPDIDKFLRENAGSDDEEEPERSGGLIVNKQFIDFPASIVYRNDHLHFFQRPSHDLLLYIPSWQLLYDNLVKWVTKIGLLIEEDMELDDTEGIKGLVTNLAGSGVYLPDGEMSNSLSNYNTTTADFDQSTELSQDSMDID